jgi:hypothetical protein
MLGQGGIGGGHGDFDLVIFCLGLPWTIVTAQLGGNYLLSFVWLPAALNFLCIWLPLAKYWRREQERK